MENFRKIHLQEVIFGSSDKTVSKGIAELEKAGRIRKIAPRLYTSNLKETALVIVKRNLFIILGKLYPGAVLSHRSAIEFAPTEENHIFLTYKYTRKINLVGISLRFYKGHAAIEGDNPISEGLFVSQKERAVLENLQVSRQKGGQSKILDISRIEDQLETILQIHGEGGLNAFRDKARAIAVKIGLDKEFKKLNQLISTLLTTSTGATLKSPRALARALGVPYDAARLELFNKLFRTLKQREFKLSPSGNDTPDRFRLFAFFESYFSNYIEGTILEVEEARQIIKTQKPLPTKYNDSHDVLGTYTLCANEVEMNTIPESSEALLEILKYRHEILLLARENMAPGKFKDKNNRAGQTYFVDKSLVAGTLIKGFELFQGLNHPFAKAIYMMFLISEVHPFLDGNGRVARIMMNAELTSKGQAKIIIPTVFRDDYLLALRRFTRKSDPTIYIQVMEKAQAFSEQLFYDSFEDFEKHLFLSDAFLEHTEGKLKIVKNLYQE